MFAAPDRTTGSVSDPWAIVPAGDNPDKHDHETNADKASADPLDLLHPFRCLLAGKPKSGKTEVALAILARQTKPFERVVIWHCDGEAGEYTGRGVDAEIVTECPEPTSWTSGRKEALVIDDVDLLSKARGKGWERLDRTFGFASTHRGLSIIVTCQNMVQQVPINVRRMCNVFACWPPTDTDQLPKYARATQQSLATIRALMQLVQQQGDPHAFMLVDLSGRGPMFRLNGTREVRLR